MFDMPVRSTSSSIARHSLLNSKRRLDADARRSQLVEAGLALARLVPLTEISADDVARQAGVSKGLVFHYFPTQRDLQAAILRRAVADMVGLLDLTPDLPVDQRLRAGLDAFIAYIEQQPISYLSLTRGTAAVPQLQEIFEETRSAVVGLIQRALGLETLPAGLRIAIRGWIAMVEETVLHWLDGDKPILRDQLITYLQQAAIKMLPEALEISIQNG